MTRMTKRLEDGMAAMDCIACAKQGVVCHLLSCRNRLKNRLCDYEDVMQSNRLVEQKHGRWKKNWHDNGLIGHEYEECSVCGCMISDTEKFWDCNYCPNCGAKMDGDGNG